MSEDNKKLIDQVAQAILPKLKGLSEKNAKKVLNETTKSVSSIVKKYGKLIAEQAKDAAKAKEKAAKVTAKKAEKDAKKKSKEGKKLAKAKLLATLIAKEKSTAPAVAKKAPAAKRTPNPAFMKALTPSAALAAVVGATPLPRTEVVSKMWVYIKKHNLQDSVNRRAINADDKLKAVFGKAQVTMFEMAGLIGKHLK